MDEYCARYGVRGCHRHLCYLSDLLERAENGAMIDPTLLHYSYAFCASHVHGNRWVLAPHTGVLIRGVNPAQLLSSFILLSVFSLHAWMLILAMFSFCLHVNL